MRNTGRRIALAGLVLAAAQNAQAHGGGLWYSMAVSLCLVQDEQNAALPLGKAWASEESMVRWQKELAPDLKRCIVKSKPVPASLCKELLSPQPGQEQDNDALDKLYQKYAASLDKMGDKLACQAAK